MLALLLFCVIIYFINSRKPVLDLPRLSLLRKPFRANGLIQFVISRKFQVDLSQLP